MVLHYPGSKQHISSFPVLGIFCEFVLLIRQTLIVSLVTWEGLSMESLLQLIGLPNHLPKVLWDKEMRRRKVYFSALEWHIGLSLIRRMRASSGVLRH